MHNLSRSAARRVLLASLVSSSLLVAGTGCIVKEKNKSGGDARDVEIKTPLGGMELHKDQVQASNLGLPEYPGAARRDDKDNQSADVSLGFGSFQLKVKVVKYLSPDPPDKISAFYRSALARYGAVLQCKDHQPVGTPVRTADGLTCSDHGDGDGKGKPANIHISDSGITLKAGSPRRQHIVGIESKSEGTHIDLVELQLPGDGNSGETN